jgi:hypothetical protein
MYKPSMSQDTYKDQFILHVIYFIFYVKKINKNETWQILIGYNIYIYIYILLLRVSFSISN